MSSDQDIKMKENGDTKQKSSHTKLSKSSKEKDKHTNSSKSKSHKKSHKKSSDKDKENSTKKSSKSKSSKSSKDKDKSKEKPTDKHDNKTKDKSKKKDKSPSLSKNNKSKKKEDKSKPKSKDKRERKRKRSLSRSNTPSQSRNYRHKRSHSRHSRSPSHSRHKHSHSRYSRSPSHRSHRRHRDRRRRRYKRSRRYHSRSISTSHSRSHSRSRSRSKSNSKSNSKPAIPLLNNPNPERITSDIIPDINNPNGSKVAEIKATAPNAMQQIGRSQQRSIANPLAAFNAVFGNLTRPAVLALTNPIAQSNATLQSLLAGTNPYKLNVGLSGNINNINPLLMSKMAQELRNSAVQQQTASAAAKLNDVKKDMNDSTDSKTTDDSLFFQVHLPGMNTLTAIGGIHPQITRPARRLYVGNLPVGMGLTEQILTEFFSQCCKGLGIATSSPVLSVWLNSEQTFGFIEFRSVQDTNLALQLFEGLQLGGRQLRFGRPVDYKQPPDNLKNYVVGETGNINGQINNGSNIEPGSPAAMLIAQQQQNIILNSSLGLGLTVQQEIAKKTLDAAIGAKQKSMLDAMMDNDVKMKQDVELGVSCVLLLVNMIHENDIKDDEEYNDILDDIQCECGNYGNLIEVIMPKIGEKGCGRVFLKFEKGSEAKKCKSKVDGRKFGDNVVKCVYFKEEVFNQKEYDCKVD